jgi:hypothetical protein
MENIPVESANVLLGISGPESNFIIRWCGINLKLKIKPITVRQLIGISKEIAQIRDIDGKNDMWPEMINKSPDMKYICNAIAISTGTRFVKIVSRAISKLDLQHVERLFKIVRVQSDAQRFFFIILSARGTNQLEKKQE